MILDLNLIGTVLGIILAFLSVVGVLGAWLNTLGLKPIKEVLYAIKEELKGLIVEIEESKADRRGLAQELAKVSESARSAHHRIDELKQECRDHRGYKA